MISGRIALVAALVAGVPAGLTQDRRPDANLVAWLDAVETHVPGRARPALLRLSNWPASTWDELRPALAATAIVLRHVAGEAAAAREGSRARRDLGPFADRLDEALSRRPAPDLAGRAAVLHADILLLNLGPAPGLAAPSAAPGGALVVRDGVVVGADERRAPWDLACLFANATRAGGDAFGRAWYRAVSATLARERRQAERRAVLSQAREAVPGDAPLLTDSGALYELFASPASLQAVRTADRQGITLDIPAESASLRRAAAFLREAIAADAGLPEARLRLARVLLRLGDARGSRDVLAGLDLARADRGERYLRHLFLGAAELALGRDAAAAASFQAAVDLYPAAQSALVALAVLQARSPDVDRADPAGVLRPLTVSPDDPSRDDPWWHYDLGSGRHASALMNALYGLIGATR